MTVREKISKPIGCLLLISIMIAGICFSTFWVYPRIMSQVYREDIVEIEKRYNEFEYNIQIYRYSRAYEYMS